MRYIFSVIVAALLAPAFAHAQMGFTAANASVPNYSNGAVVATFVNNSGSNSVPTINGGIPVPTTYGGMLDAAGNLTAVIADNNVVSVQPSCWIFQISKNATTFTTACLTITGPVQSITGAFASAPSPDGVLFPGATPASNGIAPGASAVGAVDNSSVFNAAMLGGKKLTVSGGYAVGHTLSIPSGTEIDCTPGSGFIELAGTDAPMFMNATSIATPMSCAANVADGNGGFTVSNQCDKNITIKGCILNFNSAESVTNPDHKTSPTGKWITGVQILGVDNLQFIGNTTYDSPTYSIALNNVSYFKLNKNTILQPLTGGLPATGKNTDGLHIDGPAIYGQINNNTLTCGDDCIALNADDGYRTGTGCPDACAMVAFPGWTWGPINNVSAEGNTFVNAYSGIRLLSSISRLDEVHLNNNTGTVMDMILMLDREYYPGAGNFGSIDINNLDVQRGNFSGPSEHPGSIYLQGNIDQLTFNGLKIHNAQTSRPEMLQTDGTIGNIHFTGTDIANPTGIQNSSAWFVFNSPVTNLNFTSTSFGDAANNTGALVGGLVVPGSITVSGYNGPNRVLFPGFAPAIKNGDAFTNTFPVGKTVYLNTMFDEHATGDLAGTVPAVTVGGHTWTTSGAGGWSYTSGIAVGSPTIQSFATVDLGVATNFVARMNLASAVSGPLLGGQFIFRYTDPSNYDVVDFSGPGEITIASVVAGAVQQQVNDTSCTTGNANSLIVTVTGNLISGTVNGGCSLSMTLTDTANFAATKIGMNNTTTQGNETSVLSISVAAL